ncbi:hypothetical protein B0H13DRAFT_140317 [Mycena leptocephala]|nr:hypothetical protein B0H13DRAFT_140317 [Mycena leptocephala]
MPTEPGLLAPLHITLEPAPKADISSAGAASANTALQLTFSDANERKRASQIVYATGFVNRLVTPALRGRSVPHRAARDEVAAAQAARRSHCGGARAVCGGGRRGRPSVRRAILQVCRRRSQCARYLCRTRLLELRPDPAIFSSRTPCAHATDHMGAARRPPPFFS